MLDIRFDLRQTGAVLGQRRQCNRDYLRKAFTLIELLVGIAIIAILSPVFAQAKAAAKKTSGISNVKQQILAMIMYSNDSDDKLICEWPFSGYPSWNGPVSRANPSSVGIAGIKGNGPRSQGRRWKQSCKRAA